MTKQGRTEEALAYCQRAVSLCFSKHNLLLLAELASKFEDKVFCEEVKQSAARQLNTEVVKGYAQKLKSVMQRDAWYDKLLATQELDTEEFGIY